MIVARLGFGKSQCRLMEFIQQFLKIFKISEKEQKMTLPVSKSGTSRNVYQLCHPFQKLAISSADFSNRHQTCTAKSPKCNLRDARL
jgi:hypothetical protein